MEIETFEEAKAYTSEGNYLWEARYDGEVWSGGRMVAVGDVIGWFTTKEEARKACKDHEMFDFDKKHLYTSVERVEFDYFA